MSKKGTIELVYERTAHRLLQVPRQGEVHQGDLLRLRPVHADARRLRRGVTGIPRPGLRGRTGGQGPGRTAAQIRRLPRLLQEHQVETGLCDHRGRRRRHRQRLPGVQEQEPPHGAH